jgi:EmrB/QacA subfamily drug resistance transporter
MTSSNRTSVFIAALATIFMSSVEGTIVATAMPTIVGKLGGFELFSWVFTAYLLGQAVTIPIYGRLADLYGRKRVLLIGIGGFLCGSICCGFAWSMISLVGFRLLQGLGAGAIMPIARTIIADLYQGAERARMQSYISISFVVSAILGPTIGAFLVAHADWPVVFWANVPFGIAAVTTLATALHERVQRREHHIDYLGSALMMSGMGLLMFALVRATMLGTRDFIILIVIAGGLLAVFLRHERRVPEPMLPIAVWRNRMVVGGNVANLACGAIMMGIIAFVPAYLQGVMSFNARGAGFALTVMSIGYSAGAFSSGRMMIRFSYRKAAGLGGLILVAGTMMLIDLRPSSEIAWVFSTMFVIGTGMGLNLTCYLIAVQSAVEWSERGIATSSMVFTSIFGQMLGTAIFGGIVNASLLGKVAGGGDIVDRLMDPHLRQILPAVEIESVMHVFAGALHNVYLIDGLLALVALMAVRCLPAEARLALSPTKAD